MVRLNIHRLINKGKWYSVEIKDDKGTISMI